jgi:hypothetical protein
VDSAISGIVSQATYHFNTAVPIPGSPKLRIVDREGRELAIRPWQYTNGRQIRAIDYVLGARVEARDSGESFFGEPVGGDGEADFQTTIGIPIRRKIAVPGSAIAVRGDY